MARILNLLPWRRRRMERDLARELEYHVDRRVEELVRAGLSETQARRQATLELGGIAQVREEVRDTWIWPWLDHLHRDLRYAARALLRSRAFTATAMVSLALGIGGTAAIFSLIDQVLLRPLPVPEPGRLVHFGWNGRALSADWGSGHLLSYPMCRDLEEQRRFFDGAFCRYPTTVNFSTGQQHDPVPADLVSGSYFTVLGVRAEVGRLLDRSDDRDPGAHPVVVLSYPYWQHRLGGARDVVGRKVLINNYPMEVVGVAPEGFRGVDPFAPPALWIPAMMKRVATPEFDRLLDRRAFWMHVFARLKPGLSAEEARSGLQPWFRSLLEDETNLEGFPSVTAEQRRDFLASTIEVWPAPDGRSDVRPMLKRPLEVLMGGTLLLLLLATLNVAGLVLARGAARSRELTTRLALGATRARVTGQLLVESMLITLGGALLGLLAAPAVSRGLVSFLSPNADLRFRIDYRVFLFALLVSVLAAGLCCLAPVLQTGRMQLVASLKGRSGFTGGVRLRKALVIGQMAFTMVLLIGAGLFVQTVTRLYSKGPGFVTRSLIMFRVDPPSIGYAERDAEQLMQRLLRRLQDIPGVERVAVANTQILSGGSSSSIFTVQSDERIVTDRVLYTRVGSGFFATLGTQVIAGRDFDEREVRAPGTPETSPRAVIVNESFARRYFGGRNVLGHHFGLGNRPTTVTNIEIIGVVRDFNRRNLREDAEQAFFSFWDRDAGDGVFYLRMRGAPQSGFASIRAAVRELDPRLPVTSLRTFDDQMDQSLATERMLATLTSGFGAVALLLAVVGLYGVMSFVVTRRTQEIGLRLALGATRSTALWLVVRDALVMIGAGLGLGLPAVLALGRLVEAQLYGVSAVDGATVLAAGGLLALVALGATMLPGWRAASVSPMEAMRLE